MGIQVAPSEADSRPLTADELASRLERIGAERYHHQHTFHLRMHEGRLTPGQLQAWALNRYYYQSRVPMKDATQRYGLANQLVGGLRRGCQR